jgi:hypothetical protein
MALRLPVSLADSGSENAAIDSGYQACFAAQGPQA